MEDIGLQLLGHRVSAQDLTLAFDASGSPVPNEVI